MTRPRSIRDGIEERSRIEAALSAIVAERGYAGAGLGAVLERAGAGEEEFRRHFADVEDCFCAVVEAGTESLLIRAGVVFAAREGWCDQLRAVAYELRDFLREDPARARVMVVDSFTACERSRQVREGGMAALAGLIDLARGELEDPDAVPAATAELIAGAVYNRIHFAIEAGEELDDTMVRELMYTVLRPYMGAEAALAELSTPPPD